MVIIPGSLARLPETLARFHHGFLRIFKNRDWPGGKARVTPDGFTFKRRQWPRPKHFAWQHGYYVEVLRQDRC